MFCNTMKQVMVPQEFQFSRDERVPPPVIIFDLFDKISLNSEPKAEKVILRNTTPNTFRLNTEVLRVSSSPQTLIGRTVKELVDQASGCGTVDLLVICLATSGSIFISGSSYLLRAGAEASEALWSLEDAFELFSSRENECHFPISCLQVIAST